MLDSIYLDSLLISIVSRAALEEGSIIYLKRDGIAIMIQPPSVPNTSNGKTEKDLQGPVPILEYLREINIDVIRERG